MKKILLFAVSVLTMVMMSGCVNDALVRSAQAYYDSTEPYMKIALEDKTISQEEVNSLKLNMEQFKKTLDAYSANKSWYEF